MTPQPCCRICQGTNLSPVVDLGTTPLADDFLTLDRLNEHEVYFPLKVVVCGDCRLVQLTYTVARERLYPADYPYLSSTTETGRRHYHAMAAGIMERFNLHSGLAIDIGSNVGVLLEGFRTQGLDVLGIEPVAPIARRANSAGIHTLPEFFSHGLAIDLVSSGTPHASVITGTNVVAHIADLHDLAAGIHYLLAPRGVFVFEAPYLLDLIGGLAYDTIYHEHLTYLSVLPVQYLLASHGLEVFDVEYQPIHGGTLRYYIAARGEHPTTERLHGITASEIAFYSGSGLEDFGARVSAHRHRLRTLLHGLSTHATIAAVSAPAKGMTLLGYCGIAPYIEFITEKAETKIGKYTPGTRLPVVSDDALIALMPDYALLLAWNFADEIMANLRAYSERGGLFIIPLPEPRIVTGLEREGDRTL